MFDTITGKARHLPSHATLPIMLSTTAQAAVVTAALVVPALFVAEQIPEIPTMMAFVAPPPPPPAPPPPPLQRPTPPKPVAQAQPAPSTSELVAPVEAQFCGAGASGTTTAASGLFEFFASGVC